MTVQDEIQLAIQTLSVLATLVVGIAAFQIAARQTKAALFDRRFGVYRDLAAAIAQMNIDGAVYEQTLNLVRECTHLTKFLFSPSVASKVDAIWTEMYRAHHLRPLKDRERSVDEYDRSVAHQGRADALWRDLEPELSRSLSTWQR